jgi:hypothetical protein
LGSCSEEQRPQRRRHPLRLLAELAVGEADDLVARELEARVSRPVRLEGGAGAVGAPAVGLDDEALPSPRKSTRSGSIQTFTSRALAGGDRRDRPIEGPVGAFSTHTVEKAPSASSFARYPAFS